MSLPKFANVPNSFYQELKNRISEYFETTGKARTGNFSLYSKAIILLTIFVAGYISLIFFTPNVWWAIPECIIMGITGAALSFNMMHDGAHGSFSKFPFLNTMAAHSWDVIGGSTFIWKMKHNVIHHSYTNVDGLDDDIDVKPFLRMSETQKRHGMHKFQHIYFWILYPMTYLFMIFIQDFIKYFRRKIGDIPMKKMNAVDHIDFWGFKLLFIAVFLIFPIYKVGLLSFIIGFLVFSLVNGFILSIVFQLAHTVEDTQFPKADEKTGRFDTEWAIHQLKTTANFATNNKIVCWFVGGLNFQIEHHLFPKISHIHYPAISKIIRQACKDYGVAYLEAPTVRYAVASHVSFLKQMGRG
ncbi:MAG: acyl-CoA desaturase [Bacteroidetes bacterium]|nr:acyl-CoA desaturase [Bacteroidota bacterium]